MNLAKSAMGSGVGGALGSQQQMSALSILIQFAVLAILVSIIFVIGYIIYVIVRYYYPRPFFIGHTEPLEMFAQEYVMEFINTAQDMRRAKTPLSSLVAPLFSHKSTSYPDSKSSGSGEETGLIPEKALTEKLTIADVTPSEAPILFTYLMFGDAIANDDYNELFLLSRFFDDQQSSYTSHLEQYCKVEKKVPSWAKKDVKLLDGIFKPLIKKHDEITKRFKGGIANITKNVSSISYYEIKLSLMAKYLKQIRRMYDFRKGGGNGNTKMFTLVMGDYNDYIWGPSKDNLEKQGETGVVPDIWKNFLSDLIKNAQFIEKTITSGKVRAYMAALPAKISGVDTFVDLKPSEENDKEMLEGFLNFLPAPMASPGDTVEKLGFLKPLIEIPKFFMVLMGVAKALAKAITKPMQVIRILIGMILGTILYILYITISLITPIFYIPAAIWTVFAKVYLSIYWVIFYVFIALFVVVLWILDFFLGGFILGLFRCENLPDAWLRMPGYLFGNKYKRFTMCNFKCGKRYIPGDGWCTRIPSVRPSYCPQQLIIMGLDAFLQDIQHPAQPQPLTERLLMHEFSPSPKYYTLSSIEKKALIKDFLSDKYRFLTDCFSKLNANQRAMSVTACDLVRHYSVNKDIELSPQSKSILEKLSSLCHETYCKHDYKSANSAAKVFFNQAFKINLRKNPSDAGLSFCQDPPEKLEQDGDAIEDEPIVYKLVYTALATSVVVVIFHVMYRYATDKKFNFTRPIKLSD